MLNAIFKIIYTGTENLERSATSVLLALVVSRP